MSKGRITNKEKDLIKKMYSSGKKISEICEFLERPRDTIIKYIEVDEPAKTKTQKKSSGEILPKENLNTKWVNSFQDSEEYGPMEKDPTDKERKTARKPFMGKKYKCTECGKSFTGNPAWYVGIDEKIIRCLKCQ